MSEQAFRIVGFSPSHVADWRALNEAWLAEGGFAIEAKDRKVLDDPQGQILTPGGRIFFVERDSDVVGCCALMAMDDGGFEVAKMTIAPSARGQGLSRRLGSRSQAILPAKGAAFSAASSLRKAGEACNAASSTGSTSEKMRGCRPIS